MSTYLELFAELIETLGLFSAPSKTKTAEVVLGAPESRSSSESQFGPALSLLQSRSGGKVISIDISEWMSNLQNKEFRNFLQKVEENTDNNIVFFRIPFVERHIVKDIAAQLNDVLFVTDISIAPFSEDELKQCAEQIINEKNFTMEPEAWDAFLARVAAEKSDGRFYGIDTLRKIIREMIYSKVLFNVNNGTDDNVIKHDEIASLTSEEYLMGRNGFEALSGMIGMEKITETIRAIVAQIEAALSNDYIESPCIHMRFTGNPGTGKTTVARILGNIMKERGILRNGCFFEHSGRDLCGRFIGETAPKTAGICRDAYGSVLFIDEAYSLFRGDAHNSADYGQEAIDTLVAEMENHRNDFMIIMAGYTDEMEKLMTGNAGLKSRMPFCVEFPNYTRDQLSEIYLSMAKKAFRYDDAFAEAVCGYYSALSDEVLNAKDFSNARFVRNLFERTWGKAALRCQLAHLPCDTLTVEDFSLAASDKEFHNINTNKKRAIGFNQI